MQTFDWLNSFIDVGGIFKLFLNYGYIVYALSIESHRSYDCLLEEEA